MADDTSGLINGFIIFKHETLDFKFLVQKPMLVMCLLSSCQVYKRSPNFFVYPGMPSLSLVTSWSLCASGFCLKNWTTHQTPQNLHLVPRKYSGYVLHTESVRLHAVYYYFHVHTSRDHKASTLYTDTEVIESKQPGKLDLLFHISNHFFWNLPPQLSLLLLSNDMPAFTVHSTVDLPSV